MNKAFCILFFLWLGSFTLACYAQMRDIRVYGSVYAQEENDSIYRPVESATVQLLHLPDSAYAAGSITNKEGVFRLFFYRTTTSTRNLLLKISYLGMNTYYKEVRVALNSSELDMGKVLLTPKTMSLQEAQIVGELKKMYMRGDTLVYNTDAFKMPKGSVLLELVRRLPGLYFSENGVLMYMDKRISEIRLNGEGFFTHDLQIALKNVPVKELEQVKVYDTVTEDDRLRGIEEKKRVLDMKTKKEVDQTYLANLSGGMANRDKRYLLDGGLNYYKKKAAQISMNGEMLNLPDSYVPEQLEHSFSQEKNAMKERTRKKGELAWKQRIGMCSFNGNLNHNYTMNEDEKNSSSESYMGNTSLFREQSQYSIGREKENASKITLLAYPKGIQCLLIGSLSNNHSKTFSRNTSGSFNQNPYSYGENLLELDEAQTTSTLINRMWQQSLKDSYRKNAKGLLMLSTLGSLHRFSAGVSVSYREQERSEQTQSDTRFFLVGDSVANQSQYVQTPSKVAGGELSLQYDWKPSPHKLSVSYQLGYETEEQGRSVYDLTSLGEIEWNALPVDYEQSFVDSLSRQSDVRSLNQDIKLSYTKSGGDKWFLMGSLSLHPKHVHTTTVSRKENIADMGYNFLNWNVLMNVSYKLDACKWTFLYVGNSIEPSVSDLLPIVNTDDPLYITSGNPDLKSSIRHRAEVSFQRGYKWNTRVVWSQTNQARTMKTIYDAQTGGRKVTPANINGNWNFQANGSFQDAWSDFTLICKANYTYSNEVSYVRDVSAANVDEKCTVREHKENLRTDFRYTPKNVEVGIVLDGLLRHQSNEANNAKLFMKDLSAVANAAVYVGSDLELRSSFTYTMRRGYNFTSANLNESIWNASIRYKFLKGKNASFKLECYDLLKKQKNVTYMIAGNGNHEVRNHCISRFVLLTFKYRFSVFN